MDVYGNGAALYDGQDEFFPGQNSEGGDDANLEWLSLLVEDCLSAAPSYSAITQHRPPPAAAPRYAAVTQHRPPPAAAPSYAAVTQHRPPPAAASIVSLPPQVPLEPSLLPEIRGKRKLPAPPLLQQRYWLSESELIPQHVSMSKKATQFVSKDDSELILNHGSMNTHKKATHFVSGDDETGKGEGQHSRRCTHCQVQKTPQWRTGPMGPKSLCNACGVRFKSGRLLPEYRPAKSPTFVSYQHSNSHKKVMEMRMRSSKESNSH